jgi:hypothetical protein
MVQGGVLCGIRGRRLPLIGCGTAGVASIRRFDVVYQGLCRRDSSPHRNGQPYRAAAPDDPLEASMSASSSGPPSRATPAAD